MSSSSGVGLESTSPCQCRVSIGRVLWDACSERYLGRLGELPKPLCCDSEPDSYDDAFFSVRMSLLCAVPAFTCRVFIETCVQAVMVFFRPVFAWRCNISDACILAATLMYPVDLVRALKMSSAADGGKQFRSHRIWLPERVNCQSLRARMAANTFFRGSHGL